MFCAFHAPSSLFDPLVLQGLTAIALCGVLFIYLWGRARLLSFGLLWLLMVLSPVLNARWMVKAAFEERYLYLPSVGFCWLLSWGLLRLRARSLRPQCYVAPGACPWPSASWRRSCLFRIVTSESRLAG